jgi:NTE family protein
MESGMTLVLGGGGDWGVGWMTGVAMGLLENGVDLRDVDWLIGTSAGALVGAQLATGLSIEMLFERQTDSTVQDFEGNPPPEALAKLIGLLRRSWTTQHEKMTALVEFALEPVAMGSTAWRAEITQRLGLPSHDWPQKRLSVAAVDAQTLALTLFERDDGVPLIDAVCASCALPGISPPSVINGNRYIDGGVWNTHDNAHLAGGSRTVLVLSPMGGTRPEGLAADVARLEAGGAKVEAITADPESLATLAAGASDPARRRPAAIAGRRQAAQVAEKLRELFADA